MIPPRLASTSLVAVATSFHEDAIPFKPSQLSLAESVVVGVGEVVDGPLPERLDVPDAAPRPTAGSLGGGILRRLDRDHHLAIAVHA
jgi:hypothetical protein